MSQPETAQIENTVMVSRLGHVLRIELNRPKALNSLTIDMVRAIASALQRAEADTDIAAVLLTGRGERGLCAGGDIRQLYESALAKDGRAEIFFTEEYALNAHIARFPKPYIAIMDGITMGGGIGLSAHGSHRLVTERSKISMPETKIGFFPDVGATWLLAHAPGEIGTYLGLLGVTIGAEDAVYASLADMVVASSTLDEIIAKVGQLKPGCTSAEVNEMLAPYARPADAGLSQERAEIDRLMAGQTVLEILRNAQAAGSDIGDRIATTLATRSPTGLVYTLNLLRAARRAPSLEICLKQEYQAATTLIYQHDFQEGVRAVLIDKHQNPKWQPATLEDAIKTIL